MKRFFLACLPSLVAISHLIVQSCFPGQKTRMLVADAAAVKVFNAGAEC